MSLRHLGGRKPKDARTRFYASYREDSSGCWLWLGAKRGSNGYGRIKVDSKSVPAHRYSWLLHCGEIPQGMMVCHKCDTPLCVNPLHLFIGTAHDNMADCKAKGRTGGGTKTPLRGEANPQAKLSRESIEAIRGDVRPQRSIANDFGVTQALVSKIKRNEIWRHI